MANNSTTPDMNDNEPSTSTNKVLLEDFGGDGIDYSGHFATSETFETDLEAIDWAKKIASRIGFELVISSHKNNGKKKVLKCSRGERYRGSLRDLNSAVRKYTKTKACKCSFQIMVQQLQVPSSWGIRVLPGTKGMHNHALALHPEGYRQRSGLSLASKKIVRDMTLAKAKPCAILAAIQEQNPDDNPTKKDVYNYRDYLRRVGLSEKVDNEEA